MSPSPANLASVLLRAGTPDAVALLDASGGDNRISAYTYRQLDAMATGVATSLRGLGLAPGARVGMLCLNSVRFYAVYFGALRAGCTVVPYSPRAGTEAIAHVCADAAFDLLFVDDATPGGIPERLRVIRSNSPEFGNWLAAPKHGIDEPAGQAPAIVLYTSGSTGRPKGVMLSHASQIAIVDGLAQPGIRALLQAGPCIVAAPLFHMNGLVVSQLVFAVGGTVVLMGRFDTREFVRAIDRHRVTVVSGVPTMVALVARDREALARADLSCVRLVMIGSAPVSDTIVAHAREMFPNAGVYNSYGTTEIGAGMFGMHPEGVPRPAMSIGYPMPHAEIRLMGGDTEDEGVLEVRSPTSMSGYLNLPEVTAAKMRDGWIDTGDIMRRDADGYFYFVGRADDMFVCSGENVYPGEVERLLERHPAILEVCVVPLADEIRGAIPVAFVALRPGTTLTEQDVKDYVLANAAPYMHPRRVWFVDRMPLSGVNKIDRHMLKARAVELAAAAAPGLRE